MLSAPKLSDKYQDYGTVNNICDVVLGVIKRDQEWICPLCRNTGKGEGGYPMEIEKKEEHLRSKCPKREVTCAACNMKILAKDFQDHKKECAGPVVVCNRCGSKVRKCYVENHLKKCVPFGQSGSLHIRLDPTCTVTQLMPGGAAEQGGMRVGDVIVKIENPAGVFPIATREDFMRAVGPRCEVFKGTSIIVEVLRDPEAIRNRQGYGTGYRNEKSPSIASIRSQSASVCGIPLSITVGPETVAARENRRKKLQRLESVFPNINLDMIDEFMTDPVKCKDSVLEAFINADENGDGSLGVIEMIKVFENLAVMTGIEPPSVKDCKYAFREVDVDGHGWLTFDEFFPYLRSMIMEVVWAEGTLAPCPRCGKRTRERNQARHVKWCAGDIHPRGSFHFDVNPSTPLEVNSVGPSARAAGINEGDVLLRFNGVDVKSRSELARLGAPNKGVVAGSTVLIDVRRRGTNTVETVKHVMFPLAEPLQHEACERLIAANHKKNRVSKATIRSLILEPHVFRANLRLCFEHADEQGNGFLDRRSMQAVFKLMNEREGLPLPPVRDMDKVFDKIDDTTDGSVSYDEIFPVLRIHYISELEQHDSYAHLDGFR